MRQEPPFETPSFPIDSRRTNVPDYREGFLRIPLSVWYEVFCRAGGPHPLTRRQLQIVAAVIRETWGWGTKGGGVRPWTRPMAPAQLARATGLSTDRLARDLRALVDRGVLLEEGGRYQFAPYPQAWLPPAAKGRTAPAESAEETAETSPPRGSHRKRKDNLKKRLPRSSTKGGDNSGPEALGHAEPPIEPGPGGRGALEKLRRLVASIAGPLDATEAEALRSWVDREGIAGVWREVEPALRRTREEARLTLKRRLRDRPSIASEAVGRDRGQDGR